MSDVLVASGKLLTVPMSISLPALSLCVSLCVSLVEKEVLVLL